MHLFLNSDVTQLPVLGVSAGAGSCVLVGSVVYGRRDGNDAVRGGGMRYESFFTCGDSLHVQMYVSAMCA